MRGYDGFFTVDFNAASENVNYEEKAEFQHEILVWCAIFREWVKEEAIAADLYKQRLLPELLRRIQGKSHK